MRATLLPFAALLLLAAPAAAQGADSASIAGVLADACPGARVRLYRQAGGSVQGTCGPLVDARLVVREDGAERPVQLAAIREVWVEQRATGRGAAIGGGIGAGTLMLFSWYVINGMCDAPGACNGDLVVALPLSALIGGTVGGLVGGGIGYLTKTWDRRYP